MILTEYDHELHLRSEKRLSFEEGVEQERQKAILYMIRDNLEDNIPKERILRRLQDRYHLTSSESIAQLQQVIQDMV